MINFTYSILAMAFVMFMCGNISDENGFAIWGVMFMACSATVTIIGSQKHGA